MTRDPFARPKGRGSAAAASSFQFETGPTRGSEGENPASTPTAEVT
jgi:hypothetical protein